jgi:hypothetical protein
MAGRCYEASWALVQPVRDARQRNVEQQVRVQHLVDHLVHVAQLEGAIQVPQPHLQQEAALTGALQ